MPGMNPGRQSVPVRRRGVRQSSNPGVQVQFDQLVGVAIAVRLPTFEQHSVKSGADHPSTVAVQRGQSVLTDERVRANGDRARVVDSGNLQPVRSCER